ncbi:MAG: DUF4241 domain-containing protein [Clostridia bacterium]|nr:DUF4241 domain-containing protein [Clostridia bacterium]
MKTINLLKKRAGSVLFKDGLVDITDPCYDSDVWCRTVNTRIKPGTYDCYAYICKKGEADDLGRCFITQIVHHNYNTEKVPDSSWKHLCSIGVDAGLAGFFSHKPDLVDDEWLKFCHEIEGKNYMIVKDTCSGFVTSSGYGDGKYDVYACYHDGEIVALEIRF